MGFLIGAYGKLMAGQNVRDLQRQMVSVQSRLRQATKQIGQMEKQLQSEQRHMENAIRSQGMQMNQMTSMFGQMVGAVTQNTNFSAMALKMIESRAEQQAVLQYNSDNQDVDGFTNATSYDAIKMAKQYSDAMKELKKQENLTKVTQAVQNQQLQNVQQSVQEQQQQIQQSVQQQLSQVQDSFEQYREFMLMPLQDLEADLQIQKDNLESREKIAEAEYQAMKDMEKAGVQMFKPEYTGGGQ